MKTSLFLKHLQDYFETYLPKIRGSSPNTIASYQDTFRLFFEYLEASRKVKPWLVNYKHCTDTVILGFLHWLETERHCGIATRNQRQAALLSFFKYASRKSTEALGVCVTLSELPVKKAPNNTIAYFTLEEMQALLNAPNIQKPVEYRDMVLLSLLYDSGARAQELCDLSVRDLRAGTPALVCLRGKGKKERMVPITENSAKLIRQYMKSKNLSAARNPGTPLFTSLSGQKMTTACIRGIVEKYVARARKTRPDLFRSESYSPHSLRHSKAVHMLEAGVDLIYIRDFLGHASVQTTEVYATVSQALLNKTLLRRSVPAISAMKTVPPESNLPYPDFLRRR